MGGCWEAETCHVEPSSISNAVVLQSLASLELIFKTLLVLNLCKPKHKRNYLYQSFRSIKHFKLFHGPLEKING